MFSIVTDDSAMFVDMTIFLLLCGVGLNAINCLSIGSPEYKGNIKMSDLAKPAFFADSRKWSISSTPVKKTNISPEFLSADLQMLTAVITADST